MIIYETEYDPYCYCSVGPYTIERKSVVVLKTIDILFCACILYCERLEMDFSKKKKIFLYFFLFSAFCILRMRELEHSVQFRILTTIFTENEIIKKKRTEFEKENHCDKI